MAPGEICYAPDEMLYRRASRLRPDEIGFAFHWAGILLGRLFTGRQGLYKQTYVCIITNGEPIIIINSSSLTLIARKLRDMREIRVNVQEIEEFKL